jgi:hypothetical protein
VLPERDIFFLILKYEILPIVLCMLNLGHWRMWQLIFSLCQNLSDTNIIIIIFFAENVLILAYEAGKKSKAFEG